MINCLRETSLITAVSRRSHVCHGLRLSIYSASLFLHHAMTAKTKASERSLASASRRVGFTNFHAAERVAIDAREREFAYEPALLSLRWSLPVRAGTERTHVLRGVFTHLVSAKLRFRVSPRSRSLRGEEEDSSLQVPLY